MTRRACPLPPGAKILTVNLGAVTLPGRLYPPGEVVASILVNARPVPWKVSIRRRGQGPPTNPKLAAWQREVKKAAALAMLGRPPHTGDFEFRAAFRLKRKPSMPDITNLEKSTEDALEGVVIVNDRKAMRKSTEMDPDAAEDYAIVVVVAM